MNTRIRFLVLDRTNTPVRPCDSGLHLPDVQNAKSPSLLSEETAKKFAQLLAQRNKGERYYVARVLGGAVAHDNLDAKLAKADDTAPVTWSDATAEGDDA
jgi:hypothetical protein